MIPAALAAALVLAAPPDPCAPVERAAAADPALAAVYRAVGDGERAAGSPDAATAAYRAAAANDPGDTGVRQALAALCDERRADPFEAGVRLMQAGDRRGAIAAFERARPGADASSAALLEGVCLYEEGDDAAAEPLLRQAEADPAHRENARFFLGLAALRAGRSADAEDLLALSARDPSLAPFAGDLVRSARRSGRLVFSFVAESGWDSNVDLTPDVASRVADGVGVMTAAAELRPLGESGPFLRALGNWREQARYNALDMRSVGGAAGWQGGHGRRYGLLEYGYDYRDLAGAPYLSAHRLLGAGRLELGPRVSAGASWLTRFETFEPADDAPYSGTRHVLEADLAWSLGPRTTLTTAWHGGRDVARDPTLSWWENGPRAALRFQATRATRLGFDAGLAWRNYDADHASASPPPARRDVILDVGALVERDLGDRWTVRASATVRRQSSNDPSFTYTKLVPMVGIGYTAGVL
jgi:tetratricopeptide (TPR) repeat protein